MSGLTQILSAIEQGDTNASEQLLPLVYDELRKLAAQRLVHEKPGLTLQATALVHEAYLRLVGDQDFENRGHFFASAAEAMRRILVENARRKRSLKRGQGFVQQPLEEVEIEAPASRYDMEALDDALVHLAKDDVQAAELVKLRFFAGLTAEQAAEAMGVSARTADRIWGYARAYLFKRLEAQ